MELLLKAVLNTAKLVRKPVQVKGKDGKTFTRMQWINPHEENDFPHGIRKIQTHEDWKKAKEDGIHHHPHYYASIKDQKVSEDTHEDHHPHFHLPETEDSRHNLISRIHKEHYASQIQEHHDLPNMDMAKDLIKNYLKFGLGSNPKDTINNISSDLYEYAPQLRSKLNEHIIQSKNTDNFVKNVQLGAVQQHNIHVLASSPVLLKHFVDNALGEENADILRKRLSQTSALTINLNLSAMPSVLENGYKGADLEGLIDQSRVYLSEDDKKEIRRLAQEDPDDYGGVSPIISRISNYCDSIGSRLRAEYNAIGIQPSDRKPTYLSYNPTAYVKNGLAFYGDGVIEAHNFRDILDNSTATRDDSFENLELIPKIYGMEHLKDIYLLKMIGINNSLQITNLTSDKPNITAHDVNFPTGSMTIPVEIQYHRPSLEPSEITPIITEKPTPTAGVTAFNYNDLIDPKLVDYEVSIADIKTDENREFIEKNTGIPISYYREHFNIPEPVALHTPTKEDGTPYYMNDDGEDDLTDMYDLGDLDDLDIDDLDLDLDLGDDDLQVGDLDFNDDDLALDDLDDLDDLEIPLSELIGGDHEDSHK